MGNDQAPTIPKPVVTAPAPPEPPVILAPPPPARPVVDPPVRPVAEDQRVAEDSPGAPASGRRTASDRDRPRTLVVAMTINLDAGRVALSTADGPPYRGDAETSLPIGAYWVRVDKPQKRWVFEPHQVRSGLRFEVTIDGPDPFTLTYADRLLLLVTGGLEMAGGATLATTVQYVVEAVHDHAPARYADAVDRLGQLNDVDLYDVVDALEADHSGVAGDLFLHFEDAVRLSDSTGQSRVLRALESFVRKPEEYYVDGFDSWQVGPGTWKPDEERARAGLHTGQLVISFDTVPPQRALTLYFDDIGDETEKESAPPRYGPLGLTFPARLSLGTTPRLHAARKAALDQIEAQNAAFIKEAFLQTAQVLLSTYQAAGSIAKIEAASTSRGFQPRAERGPGRWEPSGQAGRNMRAADEAYELSSCGTPRGMSYMVDGVQFEGFKGGRLLDAKNWLTNGRQAALMRSSGGGLVRILESVTNQATRQLEVAAKYGVGVEWRVADAQVAEMLANFMESNRFAIRIVHIAP